MEAERSDTEEMEMMRGDGDDGKWRRWEDKMDNKRCRGLLVFAFQSFRMEIMIQNGRRCNLDTMAF